MKALIALAVLLAVAMVGIVAHHEIGTTGQTNPHAKVSIISTGETVALEDHLSDGRITAFEFYADW